MANFYKMSDILKAGTYSIFNVEANKTFHYNGNLDNQFHVSKTKAKYLNNYPLIQGEPTYSNYIVKQNCITWMITMGNHLSLCLVWFCSTTSNHMLQQSTLSCHLWCLLTSHRCSNQLKLSMLLPVQLPEPGKAADKDLCTWAPATHVRVPV